MAAATKAMEATELASAVRTACIQAALDGYEQAQIAGLCQEGAWECAVDAMRKLDIDALLRSQAIRQPDDD